MIRNEEAAMTAKRAVQAIVTTVQDLSDALDVADSTVFSWRAGRRTPGRENLHALASLADRKADVLRGIATELRRVASNNGEASDE